MDQVLDLGKGKPSSSGGVLTIERFDVRKSSLWGHWEEIHAKLSLSLFNFTIEARVMYNAFVHKSFVGHNTVLI